MSVEPAPRIHDMNCACAKCRPVTGARAALRIGVALALLIILAIVASAFADPIGVAR